MSEVYLVVTGGAINSAHQPRELLLPLRVVDSRLF